MKRNKYFEFEITRSMKLEEEQMMQERHTITINVKHHILARLEAKLHNLHIVLQISHKLKTMKWTS